MFNRMRLTIVFGIKRSPFARIVPQARLHSGVAMSRVLFSAMLVGSS